MFGMDKIKTRISQNGVLFQLISICDLLFQVFSKCG